MTAPPPARPVPLTSAAPRPVVRVEPVYIIQYIGCWAFVFWMLSAQVNDWMLHLIGEKAYIYYVAYPIALAALVFCGTALRGVGTLTGKLWLLSDYGSFWIFPSVSGRVAAGICCVRI